MPTVQQMLEFIRGGETDSERQTLAFLKQTCTLADVTSHHQLTYHEFMTGPLPETWAIQPPLDLLQEIYAFAFPPPNVEYALDRIQFLCWLMALRDGRHNLCEFPNGTEKDIRWITPGSE